MKRINPIYTLTLTAIVGIGAGYFCAPGILDFIKHKLETPQKPTGGAAVVVELTQPDITADEPGQIIPEAKLPETTDTPIDTAEDALADDEEYFPDIEEEAEEEDPNGENTTPKRITSYRPRINAEEEAGKPFREQTFTGKTAVNAWNTPKILKRRLGAKIRTRLKGTDQQSVEALLTDPEMRLALAQWELLNSCNLDDLSKLMRHTPSRNALDPLLNDLEWLSGFVYDGELNNAEVALGMIAHFQQVDPNMDKDEVTDGLPASPWLKRRVAGAIAAEFTRNGWYGEEKELSKEELAEMKKLGYFMPSLPKDRRRGRNKQDVYRAARERYLYFAESIDQGLLHSKFWSLPNWQLRYVCGWKGQSAFGTATTMRWLRDNCAAPASAYTGMHYQVPYLPTNVYGDSIFSEWYYQPFDVLYPGNFAKETRDVGAVCGGLSHFGASAACSYGVPAITMTEPGHCAYAVYFDGSWHPSNSMAPEDKRVPHWRIWGENTWSALQMQEDMYSRGAITRDAQMAVTLANILADQRNPARALAVYELAVQMQPLYKPVWGLYMAAANNSLGKRPRRWLGVNQFVCETLAGQQSKSCALLLQEKVYPGMLKALRSPKQKLVAYESYFTNLSKAEKDQWDYRALLSTQYNALGKALAYKERYMQILIEAIAKNPDFGPWMAWVVITAHGENKNFFRKVEAMAHDAVARHPEAKDGISMGMIRGAEEIGDMELANLWSAGYLDAGKDMPSFERVGGNLISAGGLVRPSSYDNDQTNILYHAAALTEKGGCICTYPEGVGVPVHVTLELPKRENIGGIVLVGNGSLSPCGYLVMETSIDGKTWKHLVELSREESGKEMVRLTFKQNHPSAKYVRITDRGITGSSQINLKAILVYDNKKVK